MEVKPGQLVTSTAGRDEGVHYIVIGIEDNLYVTVADGNKRPVDKPKRKNRRHLWVHAQVHQELAALLSSNQAVTDRQVREALEELLAREEEVG